MQPAADALALTGDAAPSLLWAAIKTAGALAALLTAGFFLLRWQKTGRPSRRHLEILDRAILGRGSSVALLRVCGKRVLVGVSSESVRLLRDLDPGPPQADADFSEVLSRAAVAEEPGR
jgi:flagellar biogenesis protein FliO